MSDAAPAELDRDGIARLVHRFYDDVRADEQLGPIFDGAIGAHWDAHLERMVEFWSTVMLGSKSFQGNVFGKHMVLGGIEPEHFTRWIGLWQRHTCALFPPETAQEFQGVARNIARNLFHGYFDQWPEHF